MPYMKFALSETPRGHYVLARVFAGPSYEDSCYAGTLTLPADDWEKFLDVLIQGAYQMRNGDNSLEVFFGPDEPNA